MWVEGGEVGYAYRKTAQSLRATPRRRAMSLMLDRHGVAKVVSGPVADLVSRETSVVKVSLFLAVVFVAAVCGAATPEPNAFDDPAAPTAESQVDKLVFARLERLNIQPVLCSDAVFVRRAYLDVIGTLPTAKEVRDFLQDPDTKNKRRLLIDRLLERDNLPTIGR